MIEPATCHEMKLGQIWMCEDCGLELQVVAACSGDEDPALRDEGSCCTDRCEFSCCGEPLRLKSG